MPTYEYECQACGYRFEQLQSIKAEPIKICPKCQGNVKRLLSAGAGFIFKGSGFYQTDYRSSAYKKKAEADKPAEKKSEPEKKPQNPPSKPSGENQK